MNRGILGAGLESLLNDSPEEAAEYFSISSKTAMFYEYAIAQSFSEAIGRDYRSITEIPKHSTLAIPCLYENLRKNITTKDVSRLNEKSRGIVLGNISNLDMEGLEQICMSTATSTYDVTAASCLRCYYIVQGMRLV